MVNKMIKESTVVLLKEESDIIKYEFYEKGTKAKVVGIVPLRGIIHDKMYLLENDHGVRVGVYEEDIDKVLS